jgi:hypothetical protein
MMSARKQIAWQEVDAKFAIRNLALDCKLKSRIVPMICTAPDWHLFVVHRLHRLNRLVTGRQSPNKQGRAAALQTMRFSDPALV